MSPLNAQPEPERNLQLTCSESPGESVIFDGNGSRLVVRTRAVDNVVLSGADEARLYHWLHRRRCERRL